MRSPRTQRLPILTFSTPKRNRSHVTYTTDTTTTTETQTPALIIKPCTTTNKVKDKDFITLPLPEKEETPTPVIKKSDRRILRPLEVGTQLMCFWKDGKYHPAKIIQRRKFKSDDDESGTHFYEYYVHYTEFNRRLDEWVKLDRLDLNSVQKGANQKVKGQETNSKRGRGRPRKLKTEEAKKEDTGGFDLASLHEHEKLTKVKNIANIELGKYEIETWYFSPYPPEFDNSPKLYFCEFCLNVWNKKDHHQRHMRKCDLKHPPGNEIYRSGTLSMFEVDGRENKVYCQNLCYMAKFFLDHKTLLDDVDDFLFYVLCECDDSGCHMVAYFSKEKQPEQSYNLACILTLPPFQRKGYGKFLIEFSYELSKKEGKAGTPEKPLSDLGKISYKQYWTSVLLTILKKKGSHISVRELSEMTAIMPYDILCTLRDLNLVQFNKEGMQYICTDHDVLDFHLKAASPGGSKIDASKLLWAPYKEQEEPALIDIS